MDPRLRVRFVFVLIGIAFCIPLLAGNAVPNWVVNAANAELGRPGYFQAVTPCRLVDTRNAAGPYGGPKFSAGETRNYDVPAATTCPGIPMYAVAYSLNFTITQYAGGGFLTAWPFGAARPLVSTLNFGSGNDLANAAIVPAPSSGLFSVYTWGSTHVIIDINGYFAYEAPLGYEFYVNGENPGSAAIMGRNRSAVNFSHGVGGYALASSGKVHGVQGGSDGGSGSAGVHGYVTDKPGTLGVFGDTYEYDLGAWVYPGNTVGVGGRGFCGVAGMGWVGVTGVYVSAAGSVGTKKGYLGWTTATGLYTDGDATVDGLLTKGGGSFRIDHPLDPENKYLSHSFVESPDMMNIYNGVIELDASGEAVVLLPAWFEALNRDFRYQLTAMGKPQPNLYIADEILDNQFRIAGGRPFGKVSWTVTGIRHDAFANAHRIVVEEEKFPEERGTYVHPLEHNQPLAKGYRAAAERPGVKDVLSQREAERKAAQLKAAQNQ